MNKFLCKLGLPIFLLFNAPFSYSNQIYKISLEGFSLGDNLTDFIEEEEILKQAKRSKNDYQYLKEPDKFLHIYLYKKFPTYDYVSFFVKRGKDGGDFFQIKNEYKISGIRGEISFFNDFEGCLKKKEEVVKEVLTKLPGTRQQETVNLKHPLDSSGRSFVEYTDIIFNSGDVIQLSCNDWEEGFRAKEKFSEGFTFTMQTKEVISWIENY
tara:strand:- start:355 stop:987 length:633 start_codon:yes stop_codon:yes gene_type:complete